MRPAVRFALLLPLLAACGEGPLDPGAYSLEGTWLGRAYPLELQMALEQDAENRVTGTGAVRMLEERLVTENTGDPPRLDTISIDTVVTGTVDFDVSGDWDYPSFELRFSSEGFADAEYAGAFTDADSVRGTLSGSGFTNAIIIVTRQPGT